MKNLYYTIAFLFLISCGNSSEEPNDLNQKIDSLQTEIEQLKQANDTLSDHLLKKSYVTRTYPEFFDSIPDPESFILEKLQESPIPIPKDGVLGGTMHFTEVSFINDELLLAEYEDGHVMGKAIYTYRIDRTGKLQFELVSAIH